MSRARPITFPDGSTVWFDQKDNGKKASAEQISWLAAAEDTPVDTLLDEGLSQGEVLLRLRVAIDGEAIPLEIIERRRKAKEEAKKQPACRICSKLGLECEGDITRHHFIPRWMMQVLDNYVAYAPRRICTIPVCIGRHRDLHLDDDKQTPKSIAQFMTDEERAFAQKLLEEIEWEHPITFKFIRKGAHGTYEMQLLEDYDNDLFAVANLTTNQGGILENNPGINPGIRGLSVSSS